MQDEDIQLVNGCQAQERNAQRQLYERFRTPLYRMCLRYARDAQEAEDFLHDGMMQVFKDIGQFKSKGALGGWVRRVVLNVVLQQLRKRPTVLSEEHIPENKTREVEFDESMNQLGGAQIFALLSDLPAGYRAVFNLYYIEQRGHQEIATDLGISVGASKSQLHKARRALRAAISARYPRYQYRS